MQSGRKTSLDVFPAAFTLLTGIVLTAVLFLWIHQHEQKVEDFNFERRANAHIGAVKRRLADSTEALEFINWTFNASGLVDRQQFHAITQPLLHRYPYIRAFGYYRTVPEAEPWNHGRKTGDILPGSSIMHIVHGNQNGPRVANLYHTTDTVEPNRANQRTAREEMGGWSIQGEAVKRATDTGMAVATQFYALGQAGGGELGFEILMPLYRPSARIETIQERRAAVVGYTVAVFQVSDLVDKIFENGDQLNAYGIEIRLYAGDRPEERNLVASKHAGPKITTTSSPVFSKIYRDHPNGLLQTFEVAGAPWHIAISAQPPSFLDYHLGSALAILLGLMFTSLATVYLHTLNQRTRRIQCLVEDRTAELKLTNERLIIDIAAREKAEAALRQTESALRQSEDELRQLTAHLQRIKELERQHIAREVHDELGGLLTGIKAYLCVVVERQKRSGAPTDKLLQDAIELADAGTDAVRRVITQLRPSVLDQLGVWAAVEWYTGQVEERSGLRCHCVMPEQVHAIELDSERSTMVFRIVQESLTNVVRHAMASQVTVQANVQNALLRVTITDDGKGIASEPAIKNGSWGIVGMYERARHFGGNLVISRAQGGGTCVELSLPLGETHG